MRKMTFTVYHLGLIIFGILVFISKGKEVNANSTLKQVFCVFASWAHFPPNEFLVGDIDPKLCSHIVYAYAAIDEATSELTSADKDSDLPPPDGKLGLYSEITGLKEFHPHLKVLLSLGGANEGTSKFSAMASNVAKRRTFIKSASAFLKKYNFDGLNFQLVNISDPGGQSERDNIYDLLQALRTDFNRFKLLITITVSASPSEIVKRYDLPAIGRFLDMVLVGSYFYHGPWEPVTGVGSPLFDPKTKQSVADTFEFLRKQKVPMQKFVLGISAEGPKYILESPESEGSHILGQAANITSSSKGTIVYNKICHYITHSNWTQYWDIISSTPYMVYYDSLISYDNVKSIELKIDLAKQLGVGGLMFWMLHFDDFRGTCNGTPYPLLTTLSRSVPLPQLGGGATETDSKGLSAPIVYAISAGVALILMLVIGSLLVYFICPCKCCSRRNAFNSRADKELSETIYEEIRLSEVQRALAQYEENNPHDYLTPRQCGPEYDDAAGYNKYSQNPKLRTPILPKKPQYLSILPDQICQKPE